MVGPIGGMGGANGYYNNYSLQNAGEKSVNGASSSAKTSAEGCQTCAEREYVDGSNDPGVSFKTPAAMTPQQAASGVMAHEQEHVTRNRAEAEAEGREVIRSNVQIHNSVCPECGKSYVSGGTTTTTTAAKPQKVTEPGKGQNIDAIA